MVPQVRDLIDDDRELSSPALICLHIEARAELVSFQQQVKMASMKPASEILCMCIYTRIYTEFWHETLDGALR